VVVSILAFVTVLAGIIFYPTIGSSMLVVIVWSPVLLYWLVAVAVARTLDRKTVA